jgi:hypothetical protein
MNMSKHKIIFLGIVVILTASLWMSFSLESLLNFKIDGQYFTNSLNKNNNLAAYYNTKQENIEKLIKLSFLMERSVKDYLISGNQKYVEGYDTNWLKFNKTLSTLYANSAGPLALNEKNTLDSVMENFTLYTINYTNIRALLNSNEKIKATALSNNTLYTLNEKIIQKLENLNSVYKTELKNVAAHNNNKIDLGIKKLNTQLNNKILILKTNLYLALVAFLVGGLLISFPKKEKRTLTPKQKIETREGTKLEEGDIPTGLNLRPLKKETRSPYLREVFYGKS